MHTGDLQLVWIPAVMAFGCFFLGWIVLRWRKRKIMRHRLRIRGHARVLMLGLALWLLGGICLFVALFFTITG